VASTVPAIERYRRGYIAEVAIAFAVIIAVFMSKLFETKHHPADSIAVPVRVAPVRSTVVADDCEDEDNDRVDVISSASELSNLMMKMALDIAAATLSSSPTPKLKLKFPPSLSTNKSSVPATAVAALAQFRQPINFPNRRRSNSGTNLTFK